MKFNWSVDDLVNGLTVRVDSLEKHFDRLLQKVNLNTNNINLEYAELKRTVDSERSDRCRDKIIMTEIRSDESRELYKYISELRERVEKLETKENCPGSQGVQIGQYYQNDSNCDIYRIVAFSNHQICVKEIRPNTRKLFIKSEAEIVNYYTLLENYHE